MFQGGSDAGAQLCGLGFTGVKCAVCGSGYYYDSISASCVSCPQNGINIAGVIILSILIIIALYVFVLACGERILSHCGQQTGLSFFSKYWRMGTMSLAARKKNFFQSEDTSRKYQHKLKQLVTFFQIISSFPSILTITFPSGYYEITYFFGFVNVGSLFDDLGLVCSYNSLDFVSVVIASTLIPIGVSVGLYIVQEMHVFIIYNRYSHMFREVANVDKKVTVLRSTYFYVFLWFTYLILPGVSTIIFSMLRSCTDVDPNNEEPGTFLYLEADYSIQCDSDRYRLGVAWAAVATFIYPVGIPLMYFYLLYQAKALIQSRATTDVNTIDEEGLRNVEQTALKLSSLRFLYQEYLPKV